MRFQIMQFELHTMSQTVHAQVQVQAEVQVKVKAQKLKFRENMSFATGT